MAALPGYASMMTVSYGFLPGRVCAHCGYEEIYLQLFSITAAVYTTRACFLITNHNYISKTAISPPFPKGDLGGFASRQMPPYHLNNHVQTLQYFSV